MKLEKWCPAMYATYFCMFREVAYKYGYNLLIHGSLERDMDLVAIPWIEEPKDYMEMLTEFRNITGWSREDGQPHDDLEFKPHGRIAYSMQTGGGGYLDISVMPIIKNGE